MSAAELTHPPAPAMELYGAKTGNCRRAAIALLEAGIPFRARYVDLASGEQREPTHLSLNPSGQVPVLAAYASPSTSPAVLAQSNAIMFFAADSAPGRLLPPPGSAMRDKALEAFFYFATDVIALNGAAFFLRHTGHPDAAAELEQRYLMALVASERFLSEAGYMGGNRFSIADIAGYTIIAAVEARLPWAQLHRLASWRERISQRPAVQAGMACFDRPILPSSSWVLVHRQSQSVRRRP